MKTKKSSSNIIAGVLFALLALWQIQTLISWFNLFSLLWMVAYVAAAAMLFMGRRDFILPAALGVMALLTLYSFFLGFAHNLYSIEVWHYEYKFNFFLMLPDLANLAGYLGAAFLAFTGLTDLVPQYKDKVKKLWWAPAACIAGTLVIAFLAQIICIYILARGWWPGFYIFFYGWNIISRLLTAAAFLMAGLWIVYPEGMPRKYPTGSTASGGTGAALPEGFGYCSLGKHVLLLLFTCGIWLWIWVYRTTEYLNCVKDEPPRNPATKLLLYIFIPFYGIYWVYKSAQRIDKLAAEKGIQSDLSTLCLILAIFVGIIPPILMQDKINTIVTARGAQYAPAQPQGAEQLNLGAAEELKKYKELLDSGVITQEEFDQKKKQLLGL